jgi:hypothetical protein
LGIDHPALWVAERTAAGRRKDNRAAALARVFILAFPEDRQAETNMSRNTTMTVRISGALSVFVA